ELFDAADRDRIPQGIRNALETGSDERELRLLTDDGTARTYEFNTRTLTGESPPRRLVGIGRDISERKARERALSELHRTTRDLMRADSKAEIGDLTVDALAEILTLTHAGVHLHREGTLVPISWTDHVEDTIGTPPELGPGSLAWQAFQSGEVRRYDDLQRVDELHNERTPLRSEIIVPLGEHGVVLLASTEPDAFDDTDRRLAALLCENATAALEHVEREKILRQHEDELERENERLDEFASLVSHDLRNPLNVASGRLELARKEYDSPHLDEASQAITRMETLIDDVLTLARDGKRVDAVDSVVLSNVVEQAWSTVETDDAELHIDGDLTIRADGTRLVRVFENLFRNSVEHGSTGSRAEPGDSVEHGSTSSRPQADDSVEHGATNRPPDGGGTDCATDRSGIDITVGPIDRDDVRGFYVEDDGVGIPADRQDRVFEAGYSTDSDGTGFGLRIVQDIVEAHGWTITVVDTDGGARFEMTDVDIDEEAVDG
ncbi:MAG: ATP-binding protein, partial [Haloplanus sp.]